MSVRKGRIIRFLGTNVDIAGSHIDSERLHLLRACDYTRVVKHVKSDIAKSLRQYLGTHLNLRLQRFMIQAKVHY
jgi:hypothetical protein